MMTVGSLIYRILVRERLEQTSALFIGIPAVLAALAVLTPRARSTIGMTLKGITICLLMSGILLGEGFICIVMAAPLFYLVGALIAIAADYTARRRREHQRRTFCLMLVLFLPLSLEGVSSRLSFNRSEVVQVERIVDASAAEVERALDKTPEFNQPLPFYLRLGFPRPVHSEGSGLAIGDRRIIDFAGGEGKPGQLVLAVSGRKAALVSFRAVSDTSHISHWLDWKDAVITWTEIAPGKTRVCWTFSFTRRLDPAWYFAPWERYAVRLAAEYLIDTVATPPGWA
jgi:hypothetical protein